MIDSSKNHIQEEHPEIKFQFQKRVRKRKEAELLTAGSRRVREWRDNKAQNVKSVEVSK